MKKTLLSFGRLVLLSSLTILPFISQAQVDGEFRTRSTYNASYTSTSGWQIFNAATGWTNTSSVPGTGSIVTIRDGVAMTSNFGSSPTPPGVLGSILNIGEGNAAVITSSIDGAGSVTGLTIVNAGRLSSKPNPSTTVHSGLVFAGSTPTSAAAAVITSYTITGTAINFGGSGYTNATTVTFAAPSAISGQQTSTSPLITATGEPIISGGVITGINITNPGSGYTNFPAITITDTGGGTGASFSAQLGVQEVFITAAGSGYATAPEVIAGSSFMVGGGSNRFLLVENQLNFRAGAKSITNNSVGTNQTLFIGGNLTAVTPISFRTVNATFTGNTNVTFNKTGTSTATGNFTFNNLTLSANTTVNVVGSFTVLGTTNLNGTGVLPVDLISFDAKKELNKININWLTASEVNNDRFEILKSNNGKDFTLLATVKAKGASSYTVVDNFPFNGSNYYKLLQYDLNGKVNEKGIRAINFDLGNQKDVSTIFPNPIASSGSATIKFKTNLKPKKLSLISSQGKVVYTELLNQENESSKELKLKDQIIPGVYFLNIEGAISKEVLKVIVQ
ncbi:T9SS type A sorting domain-containing protein [Pedobacter puniceum]|uniref:T9SS type A sorting domain-containing protein n=1 Tax=Pedobacter puniceum TaxID=2666136 RepID=A0A7K0FSU6_9SPHI|nr:T9SS type A sorting domain-containing protein [Pedobacter puniceum]MRX48711.1 T9SS type A sorting domain-containing protein [Pedobacter puniceum]